MTPEDEDKAYDEALRAKYGPNCLDASPKPPNGGRINYSTATVVNGEAINQGVHPCCHSHIHNNRKTISITETYGILYALCDDGTVWALQKDAWVRMPPIPNFQQQEGLATLKEGARISFKEAQAQIVTDRPSVVRILKDTPHTGKKGVAAEFLHTPGDTFYARSRDLEPVIPALERPYNGGRINYSLSLNGEAIKPACRSIQEIQSKDRTLRDTIPVTPTYINFPLIRELISKGMKT